MGTSRGRRTAAILAALLLAAAACSGDDEGADDAPDATTETPTSTTEAPATAVESGTIDLPEDIGGLEGIAADQDGGRVFIGDLTNGDIWVGDIDGGDFTLFAPAADSGRPAALGLALDPSGTSLYVATGGGGTVDVLATADGSLSGSIELPTTDGSTINDLTVAPDGVVYITDSGAPRLYRSTDGRTGELWVDYADTDIVPTDAGILLNGIVADDDVVLAAHTVTGQIVRIDRDGTELEEVDLGGMAGGRDGLALCDRTLYGVDVPALSDATEPEIIVTELTEEATSGVVQEPLTDPSFSSPATLAPLDGALVVTNAQFDVQPPVIPFTLTVLPAPCPT